MPKKRTYSEYTKEATVLLGSLIKLERKNRRWTAAELAERAGVSVLTLRRIENGDPACSIGLAFEAASLVGVPLFGSDQIPLTTHLARTEEMLTLMPKKIRRNERDVNDDF